MRLESLSPDRLLNEPTFGHGKCINRIQPDIAHERDCRIFGAETPLERLHGRHHAQVVSLALPFITTEYLRRAPISSALVGPDNLASREARLSGPTNAELIGARLRYSVVMNGSARETTWA